MKFSIAREALMEGLQFVIGVIERRQSMPILSNVLLQLEGHRLSFVGTDLEIELTSHVRVLESQEPGKITVPGRKLMDICRSISPLEQITVHSTLEKVILYAGKSRFTLAALPADDFPVMAMPQEKLSFSIQESDIHGLMSSTSFAMAQQDVRYYLNGLFFELNTKTLATVATDAHRLAFRQINFSTPKETNFILPRKGVVELLRILRPENTEMLSVHCAENALKIENENFVFVSRLIDGRFPDYRRVIPKNPDKTATVDRDSLRQVLQRVSILTHEKYHAARLHFSSGLLSLSANNTENEEAKDELAIEYSGSDVEIAFNTHYLLDVLSVLPEGNIHIHFSNPDSSVLITSENLKDASYVIMPMSL